MSDQIELIQGDITKLHVDAVVKRTQPDWLGGAMMFDFFLLFIIAIAGGIVSLIGFVVIVGRRISGPRGEATIIHPSGYRRQSF